MNTINKITSLFVLILLLGFTACTEDVKYDPAAMPDNAQVYFPSTLPSKVELSMDMNVTSYDIEVRRIDKTDALTVNLTVKNENPDIFIIPTSVSFTAGSEVSKITVTYKPEELEFDDFKPLTITVDQNQASPYGISAYIFTAGISAPWEPLGKALYRDAFFSNDFYTVELQQNLVNPDRYRLVDPYTQILEDNEEPSRGNQSPYAEFQILQKGTVYTAVRFSDGSTNDVPITVDGLVVYPDIFTGLYLSSYESEVVLYHPYRFISSETENLWLKNKVLQFSEDGKPEVVQFAPFYRLDPDGRGWDYRQSDGAITIVFPGVVLADYSAEIEYAGRYSDASDNLFAVAEVTLGEDVEYAEVGIVSGNMTQAALNGMFDGSIEVVQITASGKVQLPCTTAGRYTFIVVTYADDEAKDYNYVSFNFTTGSAGTAYPIEDFYGDYMFTGVDGDDDEESFPVAISAGNTPNSFIIEGMAWWDDDEIVKATFPVKGHMSIAPQKLEDFYWNVALGTFQNVTLLTITKDGDVSDTDAMVFTRLDNGLLILSPLSEAIGYVIIGTSSVTGGIFDLDEFYDIVFNGLICYYFKNINEVQINGIIQKNI